MQYHLFYILACVALGLTACMSQSPTMTQGSVTPSTAAPDPYGQAQFDADLRAVGAVLSEPMMSVDHGFSIQGQRRILNGDVIFLYEYADQPSALADTTPVSPDGYTFSRRDADGSITLYQQSDWIEPPHFYHKGRIIVIYAGTNTNSRELLHSLFGPPFAGS